MVGQLRRLARWANRHLSLVALLLLVTIPPIAVSAYSLNWIRQRHRLVATTEFGFHNYSREKIDAPFLLWLFGEEGIPVLFVDARKCYREDFELAKLLFPESRFHEIVYHKIDKELDKNLNYPPRPKSN